MPLFRQEKTKSEALIAIFMNFLTVLTDNPRICGISKEIERRSKRSFFGKNRRILDCTRVGIKHGILGRLQQLCNGSTRSTMEEGFRLKADVENKFYVATLAV